MVSAGSDVCNLCFRDNYCSQTTAAKLSAGNQETNAVFGVQVLCPTACPVYLFITLCVCVIFIYVHVCYVAL